ncbi:hypothetical protein D3C80_1906260 [compost metagenome]
MRMHGEQKQPAFLVGAVEFALEDVENGGRWRVGPERCETVHVEIDRVVTDPFDRQLDHSRRFALFDEFIRVIVGH